MRGWQLSLLCASLSAQPVFVATTNLQSIAVRVADKHGREVHGLTASDFTILEDGHPQEIAFFGAENQPVSLALLLDTSWSMRSSNKLERARKLLMPLLRGNLPGNEIFFVPFTDQVGSVLTLVPNQSLVPLIPTARSASSGTALYDALATSLCNLRTARNVRQAVVLITDGADQHSRLTLERLIQSAQSSKPQIFMIGFFDSTEYDLYKESGKTVSLVNGHEIDNPLKTFERISKESGAESFFPSSDQDLAKVVEHILGILQGEYTLAYYPKNVNNLRRVQVRVKRSGVTVTSRRAVGSDTSGGEPVHFMVDSCTVSPTEHPYPWEPHVISGLPLTSIYRDDFADPNSGWPNRPFWHYVKGGYEIVVGPPPHKQSAGSAGPVRVPGGRIPMADESNSGEDEGPFAISPGKILAYGPVFENFRASISVSGKSTDTSPGLVFRLNEAGCYMLLLSRSGKDQHLSFKVVKNTWIGPEAPAIVPWTEIPRSDNNTSIIAVECSGSRVVALVNGNEVARVSDTSFSRGQVGMAAFGKGHAVFHDLVVEEHP
jgi:VWFA-related protein